MGIYDYLVTTFARRFARGMGASFVSTLTSAVSTFNAAASAIEPEDLFGLMEAVDPAYSVMGGWLMNWNTWLAIRKLKSTSRYFLGDIARRDENGRLLLLDRPVYICPSVQDVGANSMPILYGNLKRFIVRSVYAEQAINKYQEVFMPNHQVGFEGTWPADASLATASGTDAPIVALKNPAI